MKKGKVFSKRHIVTATLVLCLAAAVWLNMRYSSFDSPDTQSSANGLGSNEYYDTNSNLGEAIETSGAVSKIQSSRKERNDQRTELVKSLTDTLKQAEIEGTELDTAVKGLQKVADTVALESNIETVIKAKGFDDALVIVSDESVTVIVPADTLLTSQTLQIQDAVTSQIKIDLEKIKIITLK